MTRDWAPPAAPVEVAAAPLVAPQALVPAAIPTAATTRAATLHPDKNDPLADDST
ncbi:MAG: hypothetical protein ACXV3A_11905 [Kineosporiaceae bacterium]